MMKTLGGFAEEKMHFVDYCRERQLYYRPRVMIVARACSPMRALVRMQRGTGEPQAPDVLPRRPWWHRSMQG
jgi:hypothetical protein